MDELLNTILFMQIFCKEQGPLRALPSCPPLCLPVCPLFPLFHFVGATMCDSGRELGMVAAATYIFSPV